ncbi:DUF7149 domain-containing protein [Nonlabens antarcticus]|uniref:DUF7149 domain-containing protein n=1 Tax=Nonlabens antarcticus TaxID=392714 RepID=UPI001891107E|nr:TaqI-like C-terminal specificity domain-containing protein [Nonlabens antarcticus]
MKFDILKPRKAINKAFLKIKPNRTEIESFKTNLIQLLDRTNDTESEEFHKNLVSDFLKKTYYEPQHFINTKGRNDLVIHNGATAKTSVGVIIEAKKPTNKSEMLTKTKINVKAFQELVLYYLRERITHKNLEVKYLVATNINEWFIFDANLFEKQFAQNKTLVKQFTDFEEGRLAGKTTDFFYKEIAEPFIQNIAQHVEFTFFDIRDYEKPLRNDNPKDDTKLISLFKLLSPEHLLKLPFANDSNSLDKRFYGELLHIIGLVESKDGGKKIIGRNKAGERNTGSFLENAMIQLDSLDKINRLDNPAHFGATHEERLFNVGLELGITWINRILFLKLLEAQLKIYHKEDVSYEFLSFDKIKNYDDLNSLFFQVLAKNYADRNEDVKELFAKVPYLNSSLFEPTGIEHGTLFISNLRDDKTLPIYQGTVLKNKNGKKKTGDLNALEYLFEFLNAYDFSSEGSEAIQEDNKTLINASVLGLIFEKINGYKDGSFFTPGFITMYMCRETIRKSVVQKFNEVKNWNCKNLDDVYDKSENRQEANDIINSIKICDPAVGSGHFLVSALNEIIAIKNDLRILQDRTGSRLKEYQFEVVNDELIVTDEEGNLFEYNPTNKESQRIQEALFHEKQTIIENCLFGVDINPNSVKICRLRLWIELLKNAYYKVPSPLEKTEVEALETLPNIDINIKCGNSLISRFDLDADLKMALKNSKWTIDSYKIAVDTYRNAQNKEQKHDMEKLIADIKSDFRSEISSNDPKVVKLNKIQGEIFLMANQTQMFELSKREKTAWNKKLKKLTADSKKLQTTIEEIKNNKIYEDAFEWRFEFPEVLDDNGDFLGFDVVIGNPPYQTIKDLNSNIRDYVFRKGTEYKSATFKTDLYSFFIELSLKIKNELGIICQITPYSWLSSSSFESLRKLIFNKSSINNLAVFPNGIFEEANVLTSIVEIASNNDDFINLKDYRFESIAKIKEIINSSNSRKIPLEFIRSQKKKEIPIDISIEDYSLIQKLNKSKRKLKDFFKIDLGMNTADDSRFIYSTKEGLQNPKKVLEGKDFNSYIMKWSGKYVEYLPELMKKKSTARPGEKERFENEKLILYRFIGKDGYLKSTYDIDNYYTLGSTYVIRKKTTESSLKFLVAILNSKLAGYFFTKQFSGSKVTKNELDKLSIPNISLSEQQDFIEIVNKIISLAIQNNVKELNIYKSQIDQLVYQLYDLTADEIKIIEEATA